MMLCCNQSAATPLELNGKRLKQKMRANVLKKEEILCVHFELANSSYEPTYDFTSNASARFMQQSRHSGAPIIKIQNNIGGVIAGGRIKAAGVRRAEQKKFDHNACTSLRQLGK